MSMAEYFLKSALARRAANEGVKVAETVANVAKAEAQTATGLRNLGLGDDIIKTFSRPQPEGFVRQAATQTQQTVRHAGDAFTQAPQTGGLTFASKTRTQATQPTLQSKQTTVTRPVSESLDDILPSNNPALNEIDDFWNQRMSQQANDYLDDVYKSIDDSLGLGW